MALSTDRRSRIVVRIQKYQSQLDAIDEAIANGLTEGGGYVAGYNFGDGHGTQQVTYRRLSDLHKYQEMLEAQIERLYRKLDGTGLKSIAMRRKGGDYR